MPSSRTPPQSTFARRLAVGGLVAPFVLFGAREASARDAPALHEGADPEELADFEEEAFGTRGLVRTRAETVSFDGKARDIELAGNVRVDAPPFHLRSDKIRLARTKWGIEADGKARLAFCPCLGTPLTIEFDKAIVAPPGELILKSPTLEVYGVPVFWLPWFWLRSNDKVGLLPPDVAYRGQDGFYVGGGVHLPWRERGSKRSLDVLGGGYLKGGFVTDVRLQTAGSSTRVRFDRLVGGRAPRVVPLGSESGSADDGLAIEARGSARTADATLAWDADVLRGRRGVVASTDVDVGAKPWDRAAASAAVHVGPVTAETGVRAVTRRGGDLTAVEASGPFAALRSSGALGPGVTWDATFEGGSLRVAGPAAGLASSDTLSYGRADLGALGTTAMGPVSIALRARGAGDVAAEGRRNGGDRAGAARLQVELPLVRSFGDDVDGTTPNDPLIHLVDPFVAAAILHAEGDAVMGSLPGRGIASLHGTAPITEAGITSSLGRWGARQAVELTAAGGAAYGSSVASDVVRPLVRGRLSATMSWLGTEIDTAHVFGAAAAGSVVVGRVRVGRDDGPRAYLNLATREGVDPALARALSDAPLEVPAGFLAREGTTGGTGLVVPWVPALSTSGGVDVDATQAALVAARAGFELRDRCRCVTLRANGAHRIGRSGVDVWLALDFASR